MHRRPCVVVCGPTASGKSRLADELSFAFSTFAVLIDSMQVYREIPIITNQARGRPAKLSGIISVREEWSVANHTEAVEEESALLADPLVFDAGTGMYLNASILDVPLARSVPSEFREAARAETSDAQNPRRASRARELELSGGDGRGSIWDGDPAYNLKLLYIRPEMPFLEERIRARSRKIASSGLEEAELLSAMISTGATSDTSVNTSAKASVNTSVLDSIGVRELLSVVGGESSVPRAEDRINVRTRRLAKRQIRWFDKLASVLKDSVPKGRAEIKVLDPRDSTRVKNTMHDTMERWRR